VIWVVLAALGIGVWMVAGALSATLWSRREFKRAPDVFAAKLRLVSGEVAGLKASWPRRPSFARWVHDLLVIHRGLALVRSDALGVGQATGSLVAGDPEEIRRLGKEPVLLTLILDGGRPSSSHCRRTSPT